MRRKQRRAISGRPYITNDALAAAHALAHQAKDGAVHSLVVGLMGDVGIAHVKVDEMDHDHVVTPGEYCRVGPLRSHGNYKFPVMAQPLISGRSYQVHKHDGSLSVFDHNGNRLEISRVPSDVVSMMHGIYAEDGIVSSVFMCIYDDVKLWVHDLLFHDGMQAHAFPFRERCRITDGLQFPDGVQVPDYQVVRTPDNLDDLSDGKWVLRWIDESINIGNPYWFVYEAASG